MNRPSRDELLDNDDRELDLLGYVLGALDADEQQRIDQLVEEDPLLKNEVRNIKESLVPLDGLVPPTAAPAGLARRTCEAIPALAEMTGTDRSAKADVTTAKADRKAWFSDREREYEFAKSWSLSDLITIALVGIVLAVIVLPALNNSRFQARVLACQDNIRQVGTAFLQYADMHGGTFINVPEHENLAVAGAYGPILCDNGLLDDPNNLLCAGVGAEHHIEIPTCDQVESASGKLLVKYQKEMGGHFGHGLGQVIDGIYVPRENRGQHNFILVGDQPSVEQPGRASNNHAGRGQNCFFEDGHIEFITTCVYLDDAIYENDQNEVAPGIHEHDSVIAPSQLRLGVVH